MKKYIQKALVAFALFAGFGTSALAQNFKVGILGYTILSATDKTVELSSGTSSSGELSIPSTVEHLGTTYTVTSIGESAFSNCSGLTSVTIPSSVTSIKISAFSNCLGLTSVTIPSSVISIEGGAFSSCKKLTSITIPSSVISIGGSAFYNCSSLTSVTIPSSVTGIGGSAFRNCSGLTTIYWNTTNVELTSSIFPTCKNITTLYVPAASVSTYRSSWSDITINALVDCKSGYVNTFCYPYSATAPEGAKFYTFSGVKGEYIYGEEVENNELTAGKPYLYVPETDQIELTSLGSTAATEASNYNGFYGNFTDGFTVIGPDCKIFTTTGLVYASDGGNKVKQYGCYFKSSEMTNLISAKAKPLMKLEMNGATTGISEAASAEAASITGIYNAQGKQLPELQQGLNIVKYSNGSTKKILVK